MTEQVDAWVSSFPVDAARAEITRLEGEIVDMRTQVDRLRRLLVLMGHEDATIGPRQRRNKYDAKLRDARANLGHELELATLANQNSASNLAQRVKKGHYGPGLTARVIGPTVFVTAIPDDAAAV